MNKRFVLSLLLLALLVSGCASRSNSPTTSNDAASALEAVTEESAPADEGTSEEEPSENEEVAAAASTATLAPTFTREARATSRATRTARATRTPRATGTPDATATALATETLTSSPVPPTSTPVPSNTPPAITSTPTPNAEGEIVHTVGAGETLQSIAAQYGVLRTQLMAYNNIGPEVTVGQQIRIPAGMMGQTYTGAGGAAATPLPRSADENRVVLGPVTFDWQKFNNCGPTTTSVMLSYYGVSQPQLTIAGALKPNPSDKNVNPSEVAAYVRRQGMGAFIGINGDIGLLERLLAAGYPVMVEQWMSYDGGVGHYRAVLGYDRTKQQILNDDTFLGPNIWRSYADFNRDWAYFNNLYIVFYPTADEGKVAGIIGGDWNRNAMWERALTTFRNQTGALALYGQAEALHQLGRDGDAIPVFEQAIAAGLPARYLWYRFGYFEALNSVGQYQKLLQVTAPVLQAMTLSEDIRYQRAVAHRGLGQTEQARRELQLALQDNPNHAPSSTLLAQLPAAPPPTVAASATQPPAPPTVASTATVPAPTPTQTPIPVTPTATPPVAPPTEVPPPTEVAPPPPTEVPPPPPTEVPPPPPTEVPPPPPTEVPPPPTETPPVEVLPSETPVPPVTP
jgi:tetratricopeptide (TPR) repeat protein/LysM repeat protein